MRGQSYVTGLLLGMCSGRSALLGVRHPKVASIQHFQSGFPRVTCGAHVTMLGRVHCVGGKGRHPT